MNKVEIEHLFKEAIRAYKGFGFDLSYMTFKISSQPLYTNGEPCYEYEPDECAGDWTRLKFIRLNPDMKSVIDRYGVKWHNANDICDFTKTIIAHELAHEVYNIHATDEFKQRILDACEREKFTSEYLKTVRPNKLKEETFCEYMAKKVSMLMRDRIDFPEEETDSLMKQDVIVTHRVSDDFSKFNLGDVVITPWDEEYKVTGLKVIHSVDESPFKSDLTKYQYDFLNVYDEIAVLKLERNHDTNTVFRSIDENKVKDVLSGVESYSNNDRLVLSQFYKYFDKQHAGQEKLWYGCFKNGRCMALSVLKKIPEGFILLAEVQSVVKGYGKPLIENILGRSQNIWWCADPTGGDGLVNYYRQFGTEEHLIRMSKWTNTPEYAFFKVSDDAHRQKILEELEKAETKAESTF